MTGKRALIIAGVLLVTVATRGFADIYGFVDEQGVTHLTNVPSDPRYKVFLASSPAVSEAGQPIRPALLARAATYDSIIESAASSTSLEPELLQAVIVVESGFDTRAVSPKGARGLMQLMPATAQAFGARDDSALQNVHAGARYLRHLMNRYGNDLELALAAYNAGESAVERHGRRIPPYGETRRYVPKVMRIYRELRSLAGAT